MNFEDIVVYPDGSKAENNNTGAAIFSLKVNENDEFETWNLGKECEVFDAELFAIQRGMIYAKNRINSNFVQDIWIFSDSQAALKRLKKQDKSAGQETTQKIRKTAEEITKAHPNMKIYLEWVPSHSKIAGNEKADFYAKRAAGSLSVSKKAVTSLSFLKKKAKENCLSE